MLKRKKEKRKAFLIRLPISLANEIEKRARNEDRALTKIIQRIIERSFEERING